MGRIDNEDIIPAMRIAVLVLDDVFDMGLSAILDTLATADDLAADGGPTSARFQVRRVGVRRRVRTHQGMRVPVEDAAAGRRPDVVLVPALGAKGPEAIGAALLRHDVIDAGALLRRWAGAGTLVGAACTGTFVLAESGLLDGHRATTTWWLSSLFRCRYPGIELDESRMVVEERGVVTAGAALAHLDLALWMVRRQSPELAALAARYLVVEPRASQGVFAIPDHLAHEDEVVKRFERWAREHLVAFSLGAAARSVGASERTLTRRTHAVLGKSPLSYVQDLRVERAVHLLQTTDASVEEIAAAVGYADGTTLRTLLRRKSGRGVRELRQRG
jgi:transcriptional regulator GlxA family with amidase domain